MILVRKMRFSLLSGYCEWNSVMEEEMKSEDE